ncbi:hypothetical protein [Metamycoplasma cloacale]|uniref:Uncharacterized protein n=1 Tax=Metamycoplasma cloacale TaxID=92401 RepID=A0A2Z4LLC0_9BACT|nr:hypothetical protein [Metamycoplasma cloacale]AWX42549.1 hypothetical protein DK849_00400 [Metamycoplasma cloacale]
MKKTNKIIIGLTPILGVISLSVHGYVIYKSIKVSKEAQHVLQERILKDELISRIEQDKRFTKNAVNDFKELLLKHTWEYVNDEFDNYTALYRQIILFYKDLDNFKNSPNYIYATNQNDFDELLKDKNNYWNNETKQINKLFEINSWFVSLKEAKDNLNGNILDIQKNHFIEKLNQYRFYLNENLFNELNNEIKDASNLESLKNIDNKLLNINIGTSNWIINFVNNEMNVFKDSKAYEKLSQENKTIYNSIIDEYNDIYDESFLIKKQLLPNELIELRTQFMENISLFINDNIDEEPNGNWEEKYSNIVNKYNVAKEKINEFKTQNYYVDHYINELENHFNKIRNSVLSEEEIQSAMNKIDEILLNSNEFKQEVDNLPINYKPNYILNAIPQLHINTLNEWVAPFNSNFKMKLSMTNINDGKEYDLKHFYKHNILIRYRFGLADILSVDNSNIDWEKGLITLNYPFNFAGRQQLRLFVRYNHDIDNSISLNNPINFNGFKPSEDNIIPNSLNDFPILSIDNNVYRNEQATNIISLNQVIDANWASVWGNKISDNSAILYRDILQIMFLKMFKNANFENNNFEILDDAFTRIFDENGSYTYEINTKVLNELSNYKFVSLGGSFLDTTLRSSAYANAFNLQVNDLIKIEFSLNSSQGNEKPALLNNNQGDLSAISGDYNRVGNFPYLANFSGVFSMKLYVNNQLKLSTDTSTNNNMRSLPIFVVWKSGSEVIWYSARQREGIGGN